MDKLIFTYLILFANFITNFAFIPLVFEVIQQKFTNNIPTALENEMVNLITANLNFGLL